MSITYPSSTGLKDPAILTRLTASFISASYITSSFSGSYLGTASFANSSDDSNKLGGSSPSMYVLKSGTTFTGAVNINSSLSASQITGSFTGSYAGTASFANNASSLGGIAASSYGLASNITSSFGLKTDITSSFARLSSINTFTQNQNLSGNIIFQNGKGIDFNFYSNASGMTSELFDDYEEGTWSPIVTGNGSGTDSITYDALNIGTYTKVGRTVNVSCYLSLNTLSSIKTGDALISLPFTSGNSTFSGIISDYSLTGYTTAVLLVRLSPGTSSVFLLANGGLSTITTSAFTGNSYVVFSLTYSV